MTFLSKIIINKNKIKIIKIKTGLICMQFHDIQSNIIIVSCFVITGTCNAKINNLSDFEQCINIIFAYNFKTFLNFLVTKSYFS